MTFLKAASALALMMALTSCGGFGSNSSRPVPPAGETLASSCPEAMELMKQGAESMEKAMKEKTLSDPAHLDKMKSVVDRLDEIVAGIKTDDDAAPVQALADGYSKILEENSNNQEVTPATGKMLGEAITGLTTACLATLHTN